MVLEKNSVIKLTDDKLYYILETIEYNNFKYIYIIEQSNPLNLKFYRTSLDDKQNILTLVDDKNELDIIMKKFYKKMKEYMQKNNGN